MAYDQYCAFLTDCFRQLEISLESLQILAVLTCVAGSSTLRQNYSYWRQKSQVLPKALLQVIRRPYPEVTHLPPSGKVSHSPGIACSCFVSHCRDLAADKQPAV